MKKKFFEFIYSFRGQLKKGNLEKNYFKFCQIRKK